MHKRNRFAFFLLLSLIAVLCATLFTYSGDIAVLYPKGWVGEQERNLLVTASWLMLIVVIPVIVLTLAIAWRYREGNTKAKYSPDWEFNPWIEAVWWAIPCVISLGLGVMIWKSSHALDPYEALVGNKKPLTIQVVALQWKWLFIYPEEKIASVNFLQFPKDTPIHFELTSEAPMNSFWVPHLGGQIYAMPGMKTQLNLIAGEEGSYPGLSANISGEGFASMNFIAKATSQAEFDEWIKSMRKVPEGLSRKAYKLLRKPSTEISTFSYTLEDEGLFDWSVMHYMMPETKCECGCGE